MYKILIILYTILFTLASCTSNPVSIETTPGEIVKIRIDIPYGPCKLRGKANSIRIKCKWEIDKISVPIINKQLYYEKRYNYPEINISQPYKKLHATYNLETHTIHFK